MNDTPAFTLELVCELSGQKVMMLWPKAGTAMSVDGFSIETVRSAIERQFGFHASRVGLWPIGSSDAPAGALVTALPA